MKIPFLDDLSLNEEFEDILDDNSGCDFSWHDLFPTPKLSSKFEIFHFFSPKLLESTDSIAPPKKQKQKKLFLSRKKNRKKMKDNILKKIKSRFFKNIKKTLKERLKKDIIIMILHIFITKIYLRYIKGNK